MENRRVIGKLWVAFVGDVLIALAISLYCLTPTSAKGPDLLVDPYVAVVTWEDGRVEEVATTNLTYCRRVKTDVNAGVACRLLGATCGWQPVGREGVAVADVRCEHRNGFDRGWDCIRGYSC